jgi:hypothetical protein
VEIRTKSKNSYDGFGGKTQVRAKEKNGFA